MAVGVVFLIGKQRVAALPLFFFMIHGIFGTSLLIYIEEAWSLSRHRYDIKRKYYFILRL